MLTRRSSRARSRNVRLNSLSPARARKRRATASTTRNVSPPPVEAGPSQIPIKRSVHTDGIAASITPSRIPRPCGMARSRSHEVSIQDGQGSPISQNQINVECGCDGVENGCGVHGPPVPQESTFVRQQAYAPRVSGMQAQPTRRVTTFARDHSRAQSVSGVHGPPMPEVLTYVGDYMDEQGPSVPSHSNNGLNWMDQEHDAPFPSRDDVLGAPQAVNTTDALQQAVNDILGVAKSGQYAQQLSNTAGVGLPLGSTLPRRLISKIVAGEFVELAQILFPSGTDEVELRMSFNQDGSRALNLEPPRARSVTSIEAWTSAMLVYGAVYLPMHVGEVSDFFYYIHFVRRMASRGGNWRTYDNIFRRAKAAAKFSWRFLLQEAYLEAMTQNRGGPFRPQRVNRAPNFTVQGTRVPVGFCAQFHRGQCTFPKCRFKHSCFQCGGNHKFTACRKQTKTSAQANKPAFGTN